jgi:hypothetical protein
MKRFFTDRVKTNLTIDCNHATDVSPGSNYSCIYQPIFTAYSLPKKPLHLFPEVCQILHKSKNTENVSVTIKNSCHTCGRLSHFGESSNQSCGKLSHLGESPNQSCGKLSHLGESPNETCGRLSHFSESLNESYGSFSPIREQNYGYIRLKI